MVFLMALRQSENRIDIQFNRTLPQKLTRTSKQSAYFNCQVVLNEPGPTRVISPIATDGDDASLINNTYLIIIISYLRAEIIWHWTVCLFALSFL